MKKQKNDILLFGIILIAALLLWGYTLVTRNEGGYAVVTVDGEEWRRYPLSESMETEIATGYGTNYLVIVDGKASVIEADCPDGLCVRQRDIRYEGETIVCLPHKLVVEIKGGEDGEIDGIAK